MTLVAPQIAQHDPDLGRQARRALTSMHLVTAESIDARGGTRMLRRRTALGSTNEVIGALDLGVALGYCASDVRAYDKLGHVRATLLKLTMRKR